LLFRFEKIHRAPQALFDVLPSAPTQNFFGLRMIDDAPELFASFCDGMAFFTARAGKGADVPE